MLPINYINVQCPISKCTLRCLSFHSDCWNHILVCTLHMFNHNSWFKINFKFFIQINVCYVIQWDSLFGPFDLTVIASFISIKDLSYTGGSSHSRLHAYVYHFGGKCWMNESMNFALDQGAMLYQKQFKFTWA